MELRQLLFIQVSLSVDTSFIAELKHNRKNHNIISLFLHLYLFLNWQLIKIQKIYYYYYFYFTSEGDCDHFSTFLTVFGDSAATF